MKGMEFRTVFPIEPSDFRIDHTRPGMLIGSCFSDNIGGKLSWYNFPVCVNPFGTVYNPASVADTLRILKEERQMDTEKLRKRGNLWVSFTHNSKFTSCDKNLLINDIHESIKLGHEFLKKSDYLILSLGTSWVYEDKETGEIVANCHKLPVDRFTRYRLSVGEIVNIFSEILSDPFFSSKKVVFTVSPIRHFKDGAVENQLGKSTLLLAIHSLKEKFGPVEYFPSYELMMDDLRDYRFYDADMIHLSETAVDYIWDRFSETYMDASVRDLSKTIGKIRRSLAHRPVHPDSEEYRNFMLDLREKIERLQRDHPQIKFNF